MTNVTTPKYSIANMADGDETRLKFNINVPFNMSNTSPKSLSKSKSPRLSIPDVFKLQGMVLLLYAENQNYNKTFDIRQYLL